MTAATATPDAPVVIEDEPIQEIVSDEEIYARVQAELASRPEPKRVTLAELFQQAVALIASATGKKYRTGIPTVSEASAVKLYELTMMWAINNRGETPSHDILPSEEMGSEETSETPVGMIPDEIINAAPEEE